MLILRYTRSQINYYKGSRDAMDPRKPKNVLVIKNFKTLHDKILKVHQQKIKQLENELIQDNRILFKWQRNYYVPIKNDSTI